MRNASKAIVTLSYDNWRSWQDFLCGWMKGITLSAFRRKGEALKNKCPSPGQCGLSHLLCSVAQWGERWAKTQRPELYRWPCLVCSVVLQELLQWPGPCFPYGWSCEEAVHPKWSPGLPLGCIKPRRGKLTIHLKKSQIGASLPHLRVSQRPSNPSLGAQGWASALAFILTFSCSPTQNINTTVHFSVVLTLLLRQIFKNLKKMGDWGWYSIFQQNEVQMLLTNFSVLWFSPHQCFLFVCFCCLVWFGLHHCIHSGWEHYFKTQRYFFYVYVVYFPNSVSSLM